jgi:predicted double-glycine peptidase
MQQGRLRCLQRMLCSFLLLGSLQSASAGSVVLDLEGGVYQVPVSSITERRYQTVMKQQYDYSCGSAAVATLLRYHYGFELDPGGVFETMYENGDQEQINTLGFSLLDIKNYLNTQGFEAGGFRLGIDQFLEQASVPAIVMIQTENYKHFVVLKGVKGDDVLIGDPARGLKVLSRAQFEQEWEGIFFIITNEAGAGREAFNRDDEWALVAKAPVSAGVRAPDLGDFLLSLPDASDFQ